MHWWAAQRTARPAAVAAPHQELLPRPQAPGAADRAARGGHACKRDSRQSGRLLAARFTCATGCEPQGAVAAAGRWHSPG